MYIAQHTGHLFLKLKILEFLCGKLLRVESGYTRRKISAKILFLYQVLRVESESDRRVERRQRNGGEESSIKSRDVGTGRNTYTHNICVNEDEIEIVRFVFAF